MTETMFDYKIEDGFLWSEVNLKGVKKYYVEGYASTIDRDLSGEVVDLSAQQDIYAQIKGRNITLDLEHQEWYDADGKILKKPRNELIPVAKVVDAELRENGVWIKAEINTNLSKFSEVWGSIKDGFLKAFSIAFYPVEMVGKAIKKLNLVNITLTGSPVNPNATFNAVMKSAKAHLDTKQKEEMEVIEMTDEVKIIEPEVKVDEVVEEVEVQQPEVVEEKEVVVEAVIEPVVNPLEAEVKALREEIAKLKAELEKPVMKAKVEKTEPRIEIRAMSPLELASKI
jgi:uncharacterized small protein (DUF1192 family)